jgi:hypothetical protein
MTVFDPTVSGLRQKDPELLGILGNSWEGPGIVGKAPGLLENIPWTFGWVECGRFRTAPERPFYPLLMVILPYIRKVPKFHSMQLPRYGNQVSPSPWLGVRGFLISTA